ncbi:hypothetical protein LX32DRAFT_115625 [Colletotrichum zoysiae]|uniref:Uncharacterized protein n=1 Tax=Colletotrichum zoysiae TaxID=1216348 RepID=A0AAD9H7V3_9PEZI|nr:hypothetical protein LX32DRAFT_115625 [Colletotrichum zoysiae]
MGERCGLFVSKGGVRFLLIGFLLFFFEIVRHRSTCFRDQPTRSLVRPKCLRPQAVRDGLSSRELHRGGHVPLGISAYKRGDRFPSIPAAGGSNYERGQMEETCSGRASLPLRLLLLYCGQRGGGGLVSEPFQRGGLGVARRRPSRLAWIGFLTTMGGRGGGSRSGLLMAQCRHLLGVVSVVCAYEGLVLFA